MKNREYLNNLFDIYGNLLTKTSKETFIDYYKEDLSLSEIAANRNISKSSVGKTLKNTVLKLEKYEQTLNIYTCKKELENLTSIKDLKIIKQEILNILEHLGGK